VWTCKKCGEEIEQNFESCWNCGTLQDGTEDPNFKSESEPDPPVDEYADLKLPQDVLPVADWKSDCSYCGSNQISLNITISQAYEYGRSGLDFRVAMVLSGVEPLLADLCLRCGTVQRFHVRNTNRNWNRGWKKGIR